VELATSIFKELLTMENASFSTSWAGFHQNMPFVFYSNRTQVSLIVYRNWG